MTIQEIGTITITSQSQPASPPSQLGRPRRRRRRERVGRTWGVWPTSVVTAVATSGAFQLAVGSPAAADPAQDDSQYEGDENEDDRDRAGWAHQVGLEACLVHVEGEHPSGVPWAARGQHEDQVEEGQRPNHHERRGGDDRVLQLRQGDVPELTDASGAVDLGGLVHGPRDLPHRTLIDERVERDELPGHDEDDDADRELVLAEPVLGEKPDLQSRTEPEVGVEQRLVGHGDRGRAQQQRNEEQHGQHTAVARVTCEEDPDQDACRCLDEPREDHYEERHIQRVRQAGVDENLPPAVETGGVDRTDPVPLGEAQAQHAEQRDHAEGDEEDQSRQRHPRDRAGPTGARGARARSSTHGGGHVPMTLFMLSANCWGEIDSWNSLAMSLSSSSAAVGLIAWSHDWAKTLAPLEVP